MNRQETFDVEIEEVHHVEKMDSPSGTAIAIADQINTELDRKKAWHLGKSNINNSIPITAKRKKDVFGNHSVEYSGSHDILTISHKAKDRKGFALGAVLAAEWIKDKKGIFTMNDMLEL